MQVTIDPKFAAKLNHSGKSVTVGKIQRYAEDVWTRTLHRLGFWHPSESSNDLTFEITLTEGSWSTCNSPRTILAYGVYGESTTYMKCRADQGAARFPGATGACVQTASQWDAIARTIDLHIGLAATGFAIGKVAPDTILEVAVALLPHAKELSVNFGAGAVSGPIQQGDGVWGFFPRFMTIYGGDLLLPYFDSTDAGLLGAAAEAYSQHQDQRAVPLLLKRLDDKSDAVVSAAVTGLKQFRSVAAVEPLSRLLASERGGPGLQEEIIQELVLIGDKRALSSIAGALRTAFFDFTREAAVKALQQLRDPSNVSPLIAALDDNDHDVRSRAAYALGEYRDSTATPALGRRLRDDDQSVREAAATALGEIGDQQAIRILEHAAHRETDPGVLKSIRESLDGLSGLRQAGVSADSISKTTVVPPSPEAK